MAKHSECYPLTSNTTWREKTPGGYSDKFTTFKKSYRMQRDIVPSQVAQGSGGPTRRTNSNGRPTK